MSIYKTRSIILKRINLGEADRIVTAFSENYGKIRFVAKGVRKIKSKVAGMIEPFYLSDLVISTGKNLDILSGANLIKTFVTGSSTLDEIKTANYYVEVIERLIPEKQPSPEIYKLLYTSLDSLKDNPDLSRLYFESKFYQFSGIFPETERCVLCGNQIDKTIYFSQKLNGILCQSCYLKSNSGIKVDHEVIEYWKSVSLSDEPKMPKKQDILDNALKISHKYMTEMTLKEFKSDRI